MFEFYFQYSCHGSHENVSEFGTSLVSSRTKQILNNKSFRYSFYYKVQATGCFKEQKLIVIWTGSQYGKHAAYSLKLQWGHKDERRTMIFHM